MILSPLSIRTAIAMAYLGSDGNTAREIEKACLFSPSPEYVSKEYGKFIEEINAKDRQLKLHLLNKSYLQENFVALKDYLSLLKTNFRAEVDYVDFVGAPQLSVDLINNWCAQATENKIKEILTTNDVNAATRMVILNAIYFKADWETPFEANRTHDGDFFTSPQEKIKTKFMMTDNTPTLPYFEDEKREVLQIPYKNQEASFVILLPKEGQKLQDLEKIIDGKIVKNIMASLLPTPLEVVLPKFKMEFFSSVVKAMKNLGMKEAFSNVANFSKLSKEPLFVSNILHKAVIEVDEKGTEAAAVTAILMVAESVRKTPKFFRATRPFLYFIYDHKTESVLFVGRYLRPN